MKVTEGNWFEYHGKVYIQKRDPTAGDQMLNFQIADCKQPSIREAEMSNSGVLPEEEAAANAHAIARVPDMVALLTELGDVHESHNGRDYAALEELLKRAAAMAALFRD
jgi:hypothetical protein